MKMSVGHAKKWGFAILRSEIKGQGHSAPKSGHRMLHNYLSHCYTIAWDRLSNQFLCVCVCVCVWAHLRSHFSTDLHEIW